MTSERVGAFRGGPSTRPCDHCLDDFDHTPWAFPLLDLRFPEKLRFCSEFCLQAYRTKALRVRRPTSATSCTLLAPHEAREPKP